MCFHKVVLVHSNPFISLWLFSPKPGKIIGAFSSRRYKSILTDQISKVHIMLHGLINFISDKVFRLK